MQRWPRPLSGFNRAQAAVIEAAILASRLRMLPRKKVEREIAYLQIAVNKTASAAVGRGVEMADGANSGILHRNGRRGCDKWGTQE